MRRLTPCVTALTTRKRALLPVLLAVALAGCATPGPLHVYSLTGPGTARNVLDTGDDHTAEIPSHLAAGDQVSGFAYDPFTDHFFLRLQPGNRIQVVDRPARVIKRSFNIAHPDALGGGDLTVRPRDGHLFLLAGTVAGSVIETTRLGKVIRSFRLAGLADAPTGIALDTARDRLFVLGANGRTVTVHDLQGARTGELTLVQAVAASLAFDAEKGELYAPLRDRVGEIGVFDESGRWRRMIAGGDAFVDLGPRSFLRVF